MKRQCVSAFWGGMRRCERIIFVSVFVLSFFMFSHPDLWETANHSYVFLESVFDGGFLDFYEICAEHANTYYYINNANYNIVTYIIFGLWELPVFVFNNLFGLALNEKFLIFWAKCVSAAFYLGCGILTESICEKLVRSEAIIRAGGNGRRVDVPALPDSLFFAARHGAI